jgi:Tol biopolymer transport system component
VTRNRWISVVALVAVAACETAIAGSGEAVLSLRIVAADGVALGAIDQGRAHIEGPSPRTVDIAPGTTQTIEGLQPGTYTVALEGLTGGEVEVYGETSVTVVAGTNRTATVTLQSFVPSLSGLPTTVTAGQPLTVQFTAVSGATGYRVEYATNSIFANAQSVDVTTTNASITLTSDGTYFVRVRAKTRFSSLGRPSTNATVTAAPDVAPLTNHIAFTLRGGIRQEVYVVPASGGASTQLISDIAATTDAADISPDARRIVYTITIAISNPASAAAVRAAGGSIIVMNADGTNPNQVNLSAGGCASDWSPDGLRILIWSFDCIPNGIAVMDPDGSNRVQLTPISSGDMTPRWSPNGQRIVFSSDRRDGNAEIYTMNADGTNVTRLTSDASIDQYPSFSPDGTKITWERITNGQSDLWSMNPDGTRKVRVTNDPAQDGRPDWSPGRERLVIVRAGELFTYKPDGSDPVQLTNTGGKAFESIPHWGPCLEASCQPKTGQAEIVTETTGAGTDTDGFTVSIDGGSGRQIGANGIVTFIELQPGNHTVTLSDIASNCTISGSASTTVSVTAGKLSQPAPFAVSCTGATAPPGPAVLIHRYSFSESGGPGTVLIDAVGNANGTIVDVGSNNAAVGGGRITIAGGDRATADYVELPLSDLAGLEDATIELWGTNLGIQGVPFTKGVPCQSPCSSGSARIFDFGLDADNFLAMTWALGTDPTNQMLELIDHGTHSLVIKDFVPFTLGNEVHVVLTIDGNAGPNGEAYLTSYVNGIEEGVFSCGQRKCLLNANFRLSDLAGASFWLGRSRLSNATANAAYNEFRVYNGVLSAGQVLQNFLKGTSGATSNLLLVTPSVANLGYVGQSIGLHTTALDAAGNEVTTGTISWTTSSASVATVAPNGDITARGPGTARITAKDGTRTGTMDVTVETAVPSTAQLGFHRYAVTSNIYSWPNAVALAARIGGHLAVITAGSENTFLANTFHNPPNRNIWIGLTDKRVEDLWEWVDDSPSSPGRTTPGTGFAAWNPSEPNSGDNEHCATFWDVATWNDLDCATAVYGLVEWDYSGPAVIGDVKVYNGHRYAVTTDALTWVQAQNLATSLGGHLVVVDDAAENTFLVGAYMKSNSALWIGLNDRAVEGAFEWVDGSPVAYLNWNQGEPNDSNANEDCAAFWDYGTGTLSTWNDHFCSAEWAAIIEFDNLFVSRPPPIDFGSPARRPTTDRRGSAR